jgi:hypothetical protein
VLLTREAHAVLRPLLAERDRAVWAVLPAAERPARASGPLEGDREDPPMRAPDAGEARP